MAKVKLAEIQPVKGQELVPICRNCRYWKRTMNGICTKRSDIFDKKITPIHTLPNSTCEQFEAWYYHIEKAKDKRDIKLLVGISILALIWLVFVAFMYRW